MRSFLIIMLVVLQLSCQSTAKKAVVHEVRLNIKEEPHNLDPRKAVQLTSISLLHMLFEGLVREGKSGKVEMATAERVEISKDFKIYTFHLRESLWSNGDPLTASDFAAAWKGALSPDFPSSNASILYVIAGAKAAKEGSAPLKDVGVTALDPLTLEVRLEQSTPYFLELLTHPIFSPVHQRVDRENPQWAQRDFSYVSNGPFRIDQWKPQHQILLTKNPCYWDHEHVQIDALRLEMIAEETEQQLFEKGELDWAGSPLSDLSMEAIPSLKQTGKFHTQAGLGTKFLRLNTGTPLLSSPQIRRALALAINRHDLTEHLLQGEQTPTTALVPPFFSLQEEPYFRDGDVEAARALFDEALTTLQLPRAALSELTYLYRSSERNHQLAQAIQQQWKAAFDIEVHLEAVEGKIFFSRIAQNDYQIALGDWTCDFADPINFLEVFKYNKGSNHTAWENPEYVALLDASATLSGTERTQVLARAETLLIQEMPIIPLYSINLMYVSQPYLKNVVLSPGGVIDFKWASIEETR